MYIASAYSIEFYTVKISIWTGLVVILTKIHSIELSYGINIVIIQLRFQKVQSYTSLKCEKKTLKDTISIYKRFLLRNNTIKRIPTIIKKCSTQLLNLVTCYHFFYLGFKNKHYQCSRIQNIEYLIPVLCIYRGQWIWWGSSCVYRSLTPSIVLFLRI